MDKKNASDIDEVLLRAEGITKTFGRTVALDDVNIEVRKGQIHAVAGENGAGKTTLLRVLAGLAMPDSGCIYINDEVYPGYSRSQAIALGIALVPQQLQLVNDLSIADNLFLGRWPMRGRFIDSATMRQESIRVLQAVGLTLSPDVLVGELPYVQKQMVEIARVTELFSPRVIIFDEPTASLSVREIKILFGLIRNLQSTGVGIMYVSHFLSEIAQLADLVTVLRDGRLVATERIETLTTEKITRYMIGNVPDLYPAREVEVGKPLLSVRDVHTASLKDLTFEVAEGEIVGIVAPKGEGVSQFLRALCGISGKTPVGEILLKGTEFRPKNSQQAAKRGVGYLSEDRHKWGIVKGRSVRENLTWSSLDQLKRFWFLLDTKLEIQVVTRLIREFFIKTPGVDAPIEALSGGNQQKVLVARLLNVGYSLYIVDDPTFGVDVGSKSEINKLLNRAVSFGAAVLMHSSDLAQLLEMSDRILLIRDGRVLKEYMKGALSMAECERCLAAEIEDVKQWQ